MVTYYICSEVYLQTIQSVLKEENAVVSGVEIGDDIYLLKFVKTSAITKLNNVDSIVIDLSACRDPDDDIISALEALRTLNDKIRIIILAANRYPGDELLTRCFHLGIWNIVQSDDFAVIRNELAVCITTGKSFKAASVFKDAKKDKPVLRQEIRRVVNKVMVGMAGSQERIGTTHHCITLANTLRKRGFLVAVVECNNSAAFEAVRSSFDEPLIDGRYFNLNGVDYYPAPDPQPDSGHAAHLAEIIAKSYNFVIADFGKYNSCDLVTYHKSEIKLLICGSRPWELAKVNDTFHIQGTLDSLHFCFNFVSPENEKGIREGMAGIDRVHFLPYTQDPFYEGSFPDVDEIFKNYLPKVIEPEKKKKGLFKWNKG
ncbi:hypothetical protein [Fusibacillus kribbianus]|uniref:Uncharacterized protein n=1 Tax=Fusibacillus kribbianus TaxID=3044208 RepID=A0AAP4BCP4_9FIRM|nr:hypothetical protein [Ruminococcus sp. YH-rum2234]MDI9241909.1 hypothetical protein [Ruminococcus sp. YH-rum2234]